jgi:hypothetical protein
MMNFNQVNEKISSNGYRRRAGVRKFYDDDYNLIKAYDYEHRKKADMFTVYTNEFDSVEYIEFTKIIMNRETGGISQQVFKIDTFSGLAKYL